MRARLIAAFAVLTLLAGLAAVALWIRSYASTDILGFNVADKGVCVLVMRGTVWCAVGNSGPNTAWLHQSLPGNQQIDIPDSHSFACVGWSRGQGWFPLGFPLWLIAALAAYAAYRLPRLGRTAPAGHCPRCGYDLRATPDRCPECGTIPAGGPSRPAPISTHH